MSRSTHTVVADSSVLFRFIHIGRMDLLGRCPWEIVVPNLVADEILYPKQRRTYAEAESRGFVTEQNVNAAGAHDMLLQLKRISDLGDGECSAMALAAQFMCPVALEDRPAIGLARLLMLPIVGVTDIIATLIRDGRLGLEEADAYLDEWRHKHSFALKISSFRELL